LLTNTETNHNENITSLAEPIIIAGINLAGILVGRRGESRRLGWGRGVRSAGGGPGEG